MHWEFFAVLLLASCRQGEHEDNSTKVSKLVPHSGKSEPVYVTSQERETKGRTNLIHGLSRGHVVYQQVVVDRK